MGQGRKTRRTRQLGRIQGNALHCEPGSGPERAAEGHKPRPGQSEPSERRDDGGLDSQRDGYRWRRHILQVLPEGTGHVEQLGREEGLEHHPHLVVDDDRAAPSFNLYQEDAAPSVSEARFEALGEAIWAVYDLYAIAKSLGPRVAPAQSDKVGRNDPCPCGSGKKYKKCHGA